MAFGSEYLFKTINRSLSILYYAYSFRSFNNQHRNNAHKNLLI